MKNLKKLFAVIVAVAMLATFAIPAFAAVPSDVEGTEYEDAVTRLVALGIITGRPDGTFAPEDTITRAEFAAVVVRMLGYGSAANAAKGQTKFSDVQAEYWASGYINLANSLGIINGRPDGTFGPNDPVRYEEAVTMIVRALGYEPAAQAKGGYPTGYLVIAAEEGVDDNAEGVAGMFANRGLVAQLVDNSLEVPLMVQVGYGTEVKYVKSGTEDTDEQTLLDSKLKLDKYEDVKVLSIDGDEIEVKLSTDDGGAKEKYTAFEGLSLLGLEDAVVTLWVKDDVVYNIESDTTTYYDFIAEVNETDDPDELDDDDLEDITEIKLENADSTFDAELASVEVDKDDKSLKSYDAKNLLNLFAKVVVNDGIITDIEAYTLETGGIITAVDDDYVEYTEGNDEERKVRDVEDAESLLVIIDGEAAEYADLAEDMYVDFYKDGDDNFVFVANTSQLEGELTRAKSDEIAIDGEYTDLAGTSYYSTDNGDEYNEVENSDSFADLLGSDVVAYLDNQGNIAYVKGDVEETTDTFYGFAIAVDKFSDEIRITKNVDGEAKDVTFETDLDDDSVELSEIPVNGDGNDDDGDEITTDLDSVDEVLAVFYKFTIDEDSVITKIEKISEDMGDEFAVKFNEDSDYIDGEDNIYMEDDTLIFEITSDEDGNYEIEIHEWDSIKDSNIESDDTVDAYYYDDVTPEVVILNVSSGTVSFGASEGNLGFILSKERIDADNYEVELAVNGDIVTYVVDEDDDKGAEENEPIAYKVTGDDTIEIVAVATYDNLSDFEDVKDITTDDEDNWTQVSGEVVEDSIDGRFLAIEGEGTLKVAEDAIIYKVSGEDMDEFDEASVSDIIDDDEDGNNDIIEALVADGVIKLMFFWEQ